MVDFHIYTSLCLSTFRRPCKYLHVPSVAIITRLRLACFLPSHSLTQLLSDPGDPMTDSGPSAMEVDPH